MNMEKLIEEIKTAFAMPNDKEKNEQMGRKLNYQVEEYKRQERYFQELIQKERIDLSDYISRKMARIEVLKEMSQGTISKREELESTFESIKTAMEERI